MKCKKDKKIREESFVEIFVLKQSGPELLVLTESQTASPTLFFVVEHDVDPQTYIQCKHIKGNKTTYAK